MLNWLRSVKSNELKPKSYDRLEQTLTYQVIPYIGHLQVAAIQPDDVQKMVNELKDKGLSYSTIKKAYDAVNDCFRNGVIKRTVIYNPALGVSIPAKKSFGKTKIKCYTKEEAELLCKASTACYKNGKPIYRLGNIVKLTLNTGLRLGELLGLRWEDISFENRTITVYQTVVVVKDRNINSENKYLSLTQDSAKTTSSERTIYRTTRHSRLSRSSTRSQAHSRMCYQEKRGIRLHLDIQTDFSEKLLSQQDSRKRKCMGSILSVILLQAVFLKTEKM